MNKQEKLYAIDECILDMQTTQRRMSRAAKILNGIDRGDCEFKKLALVDVEVNEIFSKYEKTAQKVESDFLGYLQEILEIKQKYLKEGESTLKELEAPPIKKTEKATEGNMKRFLFVDHKRMMFGWAVSIIASLLLSMIFEPNSFCSNLLTVGILNFLAFIFIFFVVKKTYRKSEREASDLFQALMLGLMISNFVIPGALS